MCLEKSLWFLCVKSLSPHPQSTTQQHLKFSLFFSSTFFFPLSECTNDSYFRFAQFKPMKCDFTKCAFQALCPLCITTSGSFLSANPSAIFEIKSTWILSRFGSDRHVKTSQKRPHPPNLVHPNLTCNFIFSPILFSLPVFCLTVCLSFLNFLSLSFHFPSFFPLPSIFNWRTTVDRE